MAFSGAVRTASPHNRVKRNNDPALQSAYPAMTIRLLEREFPTDRLPLLRWLMFTGVTAFGFVIAWH